MKKLIIHFVIGFITLYLASKFIPGVQVLGDFKASLKILIFAGIVLGTANYFIKPLINIVTLPLRLLTFGVFGIIINMLMVWLTDILFPKLIIVGFWPLFWTGLLIWLLNIFVLKAAKRYL